MGGEGRVGYVQRVGMGHVEWVEREGWDMCRGWGWGVWSGWRGKGGICVWRRMGYVRESVGWDMCADGGDEICVCEVEWVECRMG